MKSCVIVSVKAEGKERASAEMENTQKADPDGWLIEHGDALYRFAMLRLRNQHLAEDMVQETLVNAFRNFPKFRGEASVRTWLFQILRNEISGHFRSAQTRRSVSESAAEAPSMSELLCPNVSVKQFRSGVERDEFWQVVQTCFDKMPEQLLDTFQYRLANSDQTAQALCEQLGISESNFNVRLFRSRLMLRKCLESNWFDV